MQESEFNKKPTMPLATIQAIIAEGTMHSESSIALRSAEENHLGNVDLPRLTEEQMNGSGTKP